MAAPRSDRIPSSLGPFRLILRLGQGGFAPVWLAEEVHEGRKLRDVAVKLFFLPDDIPRGSPRAASWLDEVIDEARALCRVEHANVVRFLTLQRDDAEGIVGLVMEHIAGDNLGAVLQRRGRLAERAVLDVGISVAWALAAVHTAGLVHRDVKPENIIEAAAGHRLIDFGIVANAPREADGGGSPVRLVGTPGYIAPEYLEHRAPPSPAGDLYALGVTLFMLANGRLPTRASGAPGGADAPYARSDRPEEETSLADLIRLLLDPDPATRPRHADWVARELERLRAGAVASIERSGPAPSPGSVTTRDVARERLLRDGRRLPEPLAALFDEVQSTGDDDGASDSERGIRELGLALLRYAFALGMALLAAAPSSRPPARVAHVLGLHPRPEAAWLPLLHAVHDALRAVDAPSARLLAFAVDPSLSARFAALLRHSPAPPAWTRWVADAFDQAEGLLSVPIDDSSYSILGERRISLAPWLPRAGGARLLPEVPAAPGKPWRAADPVSGERRDDPELDRAVRRWLGGDPEAAPDSHDTVCEPDRRPPLAGRDEALASLERAAREAQQGSARIVLVTGPMGVGRSRLLDAAVERAGFARDRTLRVQGSPERPSPLRPLLLAVRAQAGSAAFGALEAALEQALSPAGLPAAEQGDEALEAVEEALLVAAAEHPVLLAIDDVQWADDRTLKLLQLLVERVDRGAAARLLVLAAARDEPHASAPLRAFLGAIQGRARAGTRHLALGPLTEAQAADVVQGVCPVDPDVERAVVLGSGRVPFFLVNALLAWRETGAIVWRDRAFRAAGASLLGAEVPGVAALLDARLASYFAPGSPLWRASLRALAAVALHGDALPVETLLRACGGDRSVEDALEALVDASILVASGEPLAYRFAQEMVRQAALNLVRQKPWFYSLHRALLDAIARGPDGAADAAFLALGYERLGDRDEARLWLERATRSALSAGQFAEAVGLGDRLAALAPDPESRAAAARATVRALVRGRQTEEARERIERLDTGTRDVRWRVVRLEVARALSEPADDPDLLADADALADGALACEARIALAGVAPREQAIDLANEAVALAERLGPELEFSARVLRAELIYAADLRDPHLVERDLRRALAIAHATSSPWQQVHIEGDLVVIEAELGDLGAAIDSLRRLAQRAESLGMRGQLRTLLNNLSAFLTRDGRFAEAALVAERTAKLAADAGDPSLRGAALSLRAEALLATGELDLALASVAEAELLQRERDDRVRALTLLRRADILEAMGEHEDALAEARAAQETAQQHEERGFFVTAVLWETLHLARRGAASTDDVRGALAATRAAGVGQRPLTRRLIEEAAAWVDKATAPFNR